MSAIDTSRFDDVMERLREARHNVKAKRAGDDLRDELLALNEIVAELAILTSEKISEAGGNR